MAMELLKIKPNGLKKILKKAFKKRAPLMIVGPPGIGKSEIIEQVTSELGYALITKFPAIDDPTDYKGMPWVDRENGKAQFLPFDVLLELVNAKEPTICLLDDIGQANMSVLASMMHLFQARRVGEHRISDHVCFVACTNDKSHHAGVTGIIEPLKSRMTSIIHLVPDLEDWVAYAITAGIRPEVVGFIRFRGMEMLSNFQPTMDLTNSPSPRGNKAVSDILDLDLDDRDLELAMIQGACGRGYAVEFDGFKRLFASLDDPRRILTNPDAVNVPTNQPDVLFAYCSAVSSMAEPEHMDNIVKFARRLPVEFQIKLLQFDCKAADIENHSTGAYTNWALDNQGVLKRAA